MCMTSVILDPDKITKGKSKWDDGGNNKVYARRAKKGAKKGAKNDQDLVTKDVGLEKEGTLLLANGDRGDEVVKELVVVADGVVKIDLKGVRSKDELKELRERFKGDLEKVRCLGKKLDDKEAELTAFSTVVSGGVGGGGDGVEGYSRSQYSGNGGVEGRGLVGTGAEMRDDFMDRRPVMPIVTDAVDRRALMRINSEMGSVTNSDMRPYQPYQQLSVSVVDNNHYGVGEYGSEKRTPKANQYYRNTDFVLGKDRLPPETINKPKGKRGRKRKHGKESVNGGASMFKSCSNLLQRLMKHKFGWVFNEPVNAKFLGLHDYHDIIKHPMDFGTIKSRLAQNFYKSPMEFANDVRLTFHNAMTYNPKGQDVHVMAEQLSNIFEEKWAMIESQSNQDWSYGMIYNASTPTPTSRQAPHFAHAPARQLYRSESVSLPSLPSMTIQKPTIYAPPPIRTPMPKKPKAREPNKRNMTYEEKQKLSENLQSLPSEKLDNIVHIIKKKNPSLSQNDEEIEVDIDSVDIETLWELDRFVTNYKKSLSKHQKNVEQVRVDAGDAYRTLSEIPVTFVPEAPNRNQTSAKTLAGNPTDQRNNGSRSSSSSSSSSDSSSSDSDSDSSSESDAGHSPRN